MPLLAEWQHHKPHDSLKGRPAGTEGGGDNTNMSTVLLAPSNRSRVTTKEDIQ